MKTLRKIKQFFRGLRSGGYMSGTDIDPANKFNPPRQPIGSSIEIDEPDALMEPDEDGWVRQPNGDRIRRIKNGMGSGVDFDEDTRPGRGRIVSKSPFPNYHPLKW